MTSRLKRVDPHASLNLWDSKLTHEIEASDQSVSPRWHSNPEIAQHPERSYEYSTHSLDFECNNDNDNGDNDDYDDNILGTFGQLRLPRDRLCLQGQV